MFGPSSAQAVTAPQGLPPIGAEIPCSMLAVNTPMRIRTALVSVDLEGGIKYRVEADPADPQNSVRLRAIGCRMTAELPDIGDRARQDGGTVTLELEDVDAEAESRLRVTHQDPPRYEQTMVLRFTMTIDQPDGYARIYEPLVLTTKDPAKLVGHIGQFPPQGEEYRLPNPVDLVLPADPETTIATIEKFPVKVGVPDTQ